MKRILLAGVTAVAMTVGAMGAAQAALIDIQGGLAYTTPPDGGGSIGNQIIPNANGYVGAQLRATANVVLTYEFIGFEAGFRNQFWVDGALAYQVNGLINPGPVASSAAAGDLLDFYFIADLLNGAGGPVQINNIATGSNDVRGFFAGVVGAGVGVTTGDVIYLALDDGGAGPNDNHDDLVVRVTARAAPVPEPATLALLGAGLLGLGLARRRRRA